MDGLGPVWIGVVIAAIITAAVTAAGWFVTHARDRAARARLRAETSIDLQKALRAEIRAHVAELEEDAALMGGFDAQLDALEAALADDPDYRPIVPKEKHDAVFSALVGEIHLLPTETVDPVITYYAKLATLTAFIDDLRVGPLSAAPGARLPAIYADLLGLKLTTLARAREAEAALTRGVAEMAREAGISTRDADPRGPARGAGASGRSAADGRT
jgi:hypothetical protein